MGFFSFFKRKDDEEKNETHNVKKEQSNEEKYIKGTRIAYHPNLVAELKQEHQDLVKIFTELVQESQNKNVDKVRTLLETFKKSFISHVLKENVKFYIYLKYLFENDVTNVEFIKIMQKEMNAISKEVLNFIDNALNNELIIDSDFLSTLNEIGKVLTERIKIEEEKLYTLYMPPDTLL